MVFRTSAASVSRLRRSTTKAEPRLQQSAAEAESRGEQPATTTRPYRRRKALSGRTRQAGSTILAEEQ